MIHKPKRAFSAKDVRFGSYVIFLANAAFNYVGSPKSTYLKN